MKSATKVTVAVFGTIAAIAGVEHGIGEVLQGNAAPPGVVIQSWPNSAFFRALSGEPAMTIIPNLLVTGILAIVATAAFFLWATMFVQREHGGLVLMALSVVLLLVGGGFGPPVLGIILGIAATRINAPLRWWCDCTSPNVRRVLGAIWPWSVGIGALVWLLVFPGVNIASYYYGMDNATVIATVIAAAFGFLLLSIITGHARDSLQRPAAARARSR